ncbi:MAG: YwiC-like family protein [Marmoricola sp.]
MDPPSLTAFWLLGYFAFLRGLLVAESAAPSQVVSTCPRYALAAIATGLVVLAMDPTLIQWAPAFVLPLGIGLWAASQRRDRDLVVGVTTIIGASAMTLVAYDAGHHGVDQRAWQLAGVQLLYFTGTVFYVKSAIRERDNRGFCGPVSPSMQEPVQSPGY